MYEVIVDAKIIGRVPDIEDAFARCLEILLQHSRGRRGLLEKKSRLLQTNQMCMAEDGTIIAFREKPKKE